MEEALHGLFIELRAATALVAAHVVRQLQDRRGRPDGIENDCEVERWEGGRGRRARDAVGRCIVQNLDDPILILQLWQPLVAGASALEREEARVHVVRLRIAPATRAADPLAMDQPELTMFAGHIGRQKPAIFVVAANLLGVYVRCPLDRLVAPVRPLFVTQLNVFKTNIEAHHIPGYAPTHQRCKPSRRRAPFHPASSAHCHHHQ
mmetsp:Transcript_51587/g.145407  ORF Transcript_51587/g.145407 Transcript_51587/m.145407 type:complete len:206 (-) Transcript_51587:126-743(-)